MAKNPDERYPTVAAMNQAYQAAVKGAPQMDAEWLHLGGGGDSVAVARRVERPSSGDDYPARRSPVLWLVIGAVLALGVAAIVGASALSSMGAANGTQAALGLTAPAATQSQVVVVPTATGPPATATPAVSAECPQVRLVGFQRAGSEVSWAIFNGQPSTISVTGLRFALPLDNTLEDVRLGGQSMIDPTSAGPGSQVPDLVALGGDHSQVLAGATLPILLRYTWEDDSPLYRLSVSFDTGCTLETTFSVNR